MTKQSRFTSSQGANLLADGGVRYRTWAPGKEVSVAVSPASGGNKRVLLLGKESGGYRTGMDADGRAGDRYKYLFDGNEWPDPASRFNPEGVQGPAEVVDSRNYEWAENDWVAPPLSQLVIYELHIGTFTPAGTFRGAIDKLDHVAALGANAIEVMPVADFPGRWNWGYDGVLLYAPAHVYGSPNDLRALVDAAHAHGLAVILDVVYNHLGPDGNYLGCYSREYFNPTHKTPWGDGFNFELQPVRDFFVENALYWRREFRVDGFRLDATHAIVDASPRHVLAEIAERVQSLGGFVVAEDERNDATLLSTRCEGGLGLDAIWSDDFHHVVRVMLTNTEEGYFQSYGGTIEELCATLDHGWLLEGEDRVPQVPGRPGMAANLRPEQFIFCIMNHDQVGNHAFGLRLDQLVSPAAYRAASALLCLVPYTPLIFMGQEWAASAPFLYFTDHEPELGHKVTEGRREEFRTFTAFRDPQARARIPDPQAEETFTRSKLPWNEVKTEPHAGTLELYREFLRLRREVPALQDRSRGNFSVSSPGAGVLGLHFGAHREEPWLVLADLIGGHRMPNLEAGTDWELVLSSNESRFGGNEGAPFSEPEVRVLRLTNRS